MRIEQFENATTELESKGYEYLGLGLNIFSTHHWCEREFNQLVYKDIGEHRWSKDFVETMKKLEGQSDYEIASVAVSMEYFFVRKKGDEKSQEQ